MADLLYHFTWYEKKHKKYLYKLRKALLNNCDF